MLCDFLIRAIGTLSSELVGWYKQERTTFVTGFTILLPLTILLGLPILLYCTFVSYRRFGNLDLREFKDRLDITSSDAMQYWYLKFPDGCKNCKCGKRPALIPVRSLRWLLPSLGKVTCWNCNGEVDAEVHT